jgi:hypothetical protein
MAPWPEVAVDHGLCRQKPLCLIGRFEPLHLSLSSSHGPMRILCAIVQVPARLMPDIWQDRQLSDTIAAQAISNDASELVSQPMQQALEETLGGCAVPPTLHKDVEYYPVLVHGAPQIVQHTSDADEHLVEVPGIAGPRPSSAQPAGELGTEVQAPMPDAFVGHHDTAFGQDQLYVVQAEAE